jgi:hypothetical protein
VSCRGRCPFRAKTGPGDHETGLPKYSRRQTFSASVGMSQTCQEQTKKATTFDAVWRFSEHHIDPYVSGSDMKNVVWDRWPHHDETSKERAYCGMVVSKN